MAAAATSFCPSIRGARATAILLLALAGACGDATAPATPALDEPAAVATPALSIAAADTLRVGDAIAIDVRDAAGLPAAGYTLTVTPAHVLIVDEARRAHAMAAGVAVVQVERGAVVAQHRIVVLDAPAPAAVSLDLRPRAATLLPGAALTLDVIAFAANGSSSALPSAPVLASSDTSIVRVSGGRVHAVRQGTASITVRSGALVATATIAVQAERVSDFSIERRLADVPAAVAPAVEDAFTRASTRWSRAIVGDVPPVAVSLPAGACGFGTPAITGVVDDVIVIVRVEALDGPGGALASAGPCVTRQGSRLPVVGVLRIDTDDLARLQALGLLASTVAHELGHVLGIGTLWEEHGEHALVAGGSNYVGTAGRAAAVSTGTIAPQALAVPLELLGSGGTRSSHWSSVVTGELMTGWIGTDEGAISAITIGALRDLGYDVQEGAAEALGLATGAQVAAMSSAGDAAGMPAASVDRPHGPRFTADSRGRLVPLN